MLSGASLVVVGTQGGELGGVDRLKVLVVEVEGEDDLGEIAVWEVGKSGVAEEVVAVPQDLDAKIRCVAENA